MELENKDIPYTGKVGGLFSHQVVLTNYDLEKEKDMKREIKVGMLYKHFKGNMYRVIAMAMHTETKEDLVIYQDVSCSSKTYARPLDMFLSEVDREKYPEVKQIYRFEEINDIIEKDI